MRIGSINNTTFEARIKMAKPDTTKLVKGAATALAGTASLYTGLNASNLVPGELADSVYQEAKSQEVIGYPEVYHEYIKENENSAISAGGAMLSSLPLGATITPLGSYFIKQSTNSEIKDHSRRIPD
jgi:hypothetical protein